MINGVYYDMDDIVMDEIDRMSYTIMRCSMMKANERL